MIQACTKLWDQLTWKNPTVLSSNNLQPFKAVSPLLIAPYNLTNVLEKIIPLKALQGYFGVHGGLS